LKEYKALHLFCGLGGAALGFQQAKAEYRGLVGSFRTLAGIDCDPESCQDFEAITGAPAVLMDLFTREQYIAFHGKEPPEGWREVTADDLIAAVGGEYPDMIFLSPPCKGFSGLLPSEKSKSDKYQALNQLVIRGLQLVLEAFADNLPAVIMIENVPRITSRGEFLLKQVKNLLGTYGYLFHEGYHDCGQLGGLGQHRKRYLLQSRLPEKMSSFIYRPHTQRVKSIGEVIGPLPMPDDPTMGPMHRLPRLQWKTWVRLALIPAGGDWRDLENTGNYGLEYVPRPGGWQVANWDETAGTIVGSARIGHSNGVSAISDPRINLDHNSTHKSIYKVSPWEETGNTVTGAAGPNNGAIVVNDPRVSGGYSNKRKVLNWNDPATTVTGTPDIQSGAQSIADSRIEKFNHSYRVTPWNEAGGTVTSGVSPSNGAVTVADPRLGCSCRNGSYGVQRWDKPSSTVIGAGDIHSGAAAIADPRIPKDSEILDPPPVIIALDGTWHRPLTTFELAMLQGFPQTLSDGSPLTLAGNSDARWRERIGNAVPPPAADAIAEEILTSFLASEFNDDWRLSASGIWVVNDHENTLPYSLCN